MLLNGIVHVSVLLGSGDGSFQAAAQLTDLGISPGALAVGDLDGDAALDLAVTTESTGVSVWLGNGDGSFGVPARFDVDGALRSAEIADLDGDGTRTSRPASVFSTMFVLLETRRRLEPPAAFSPGTGHGRWRPATSTATGHPTS